MVRRAGMLLVVAILAAAGMVSAAAPASAADKDAICEWRELCLYYYPNYNGALISFRDSAHIPNLNSFFFPQQGRDGQGANVNDNTMSAKNRHDRYGVSLYVHSWWRGAYRDIGPNENLSSLSPYNNQFSSVWWLAYCIPPC
jgi:hypothetical protein